MNTINLNSSKATDDDKQTKIGVCVCVTDYLKERKIYSDKYFFWYLCSLVLSAKRNQSIIRLNTHISATVTWIKETTY